MKSRTPLAGPPWILKIRVPKVGVSFKFVQKTTQILIVEVSLSEDSSQRIFQNVAKLLRQLSMVAKTLISTMFVVFIKSYSTSTFSDYAVCWGLLHSRP